MKPGRVLVITDTHWPLDDRRTWDAVLKYAADHRWSHVVHMGDMMDHNCISHFNANNLRAVEGQTLEKDYAYASKRLDELEQATPGAVRVAIEGNHDYRPEVFIDKCPQLKGQIETEKGLELKRRGWRYVRFWFQGELYTLGNATFMHGRRTNKYHAESNVADYGTPIFYGHVHSCMEMPKMLHGRDKTLVGASLGCLCRYDPPWLKGRPTSWQQAVTTFFFHKSGFFQHYVTKIFNHAFIAPDGKEYRG